MPPSSSSRSTSHSASASSDGASMGRPVRNSSPIRLVELLPFLHPNRGLHLRVTSFTLRHPCTLLVCRRLHPVGVRSPRLTDQDAARPRAAMPARHAAAQHIERRIPPEPCGQGRVLQHDVPLARRAARDQLEPAMVRERPENQAGRRTSFSSRRNRPATHLVRLRPCLCGDADRDDRLDIDGPAPASPIALSAVARPVRQPSGSRLRRSPGRGPSARRAAHPRLSWSDESPPRCRRPARGSASDACMAQLASRDRAASALFP